MSQQRWILLEFRAAAAIGASGNILRTSWDGEIKSGHKDKQIFEITQFLSHMKKCFPDLLRFPSLSGSTGLPSGLSLAAACQLFYIPSTQCPGGVLSELFNKTNLLLLLLLVPVCIHLFSCRSWHLSHMWGCLNNSRRPEKHLMDTGCVWWWKAVIFKWHWWDYYCTLGRQQESNGRTPLVLFDAFKASDSLRGLPCIIWRKRGEAGHGGKRLLSRKIFSMWGNNVHFPDNYFQSLKETFHTFVILFTLQHRKLSETISVVYRTDSSWAIIHFTRVEWFFFLILEQLTCPWKGFRSNVGSELLSSGAYLHILSPCTLAGGSSHMAELSVDYQPISYITHTSDKAGYSSLA